MAKALLFIFIHLLASASLALPDNSLRIVTENWPPVTYEKEGQAQGMAVELAHLIQKEMGESDPIEVLPWPRAYHVAKTRPNTLLFTVVRTPEREQLFTLLGPIANGEIAIYTRRTADLSFSDLNYVKENYSVAVHRGTAFHKVLEDNGYKKIVPVNSSISGLKMLMAGRVDMLCDDVLAIHRISEEAGYPYDAQKKVTSLQHSSLYFAFSKNTDKDIIEKWKRSFEKIKKNGTYKALYKKWFGPLSSPTEVLLVSNGKKAPIIEL
ncbi:transporter substrate-binding domain-containing protein [Bdellovibrio sp. 22V]|uniref:substrate-binding periplasmic protein n=1 Tax=Bdellovibrio sp. 22V TaxID=3044166 RepID=UPI002542FF49|nr:transporter substrate-binding domain-containing protein [Bdellovibrio sp. 22V]WII73856.1 transporter substrate-binding domain-containing protein [Bdellovibrio sp. 22V]